MKTQNSDGFTLIETLLVILVLAVLTAIAAPSWSTFVKQQQLRVATSEIFQSIRTAQSEAKLKKLPTPLKKVVATEETIAIAYPDSEIEFDSRGAVRGKIPYTVAATIEGNQNLYSCVVVRTLLGVATIGKTKSECDKLSAPS